MLSADLSAVLTQLIQVVAAHLAQHVASESFYLSFLYFRICSPPTLTGKGNRQPSDVLVSPQPLHAGAQQTKVVPYLLLLFLFCNFLSGEMIKRSFFLTMRQYSRMLSALLNLVLVVVLLFCFLFYSFF